MKHVSILIPRGHTSLVNIEGTYQIFQAVNGLIEDGGDARFFDVHLVGLERPTPQSTGLFSVTPDLLAEEVDKTDLIVIPAIHGDPDDAIARNGDFIPWIIGMHGKGAEIASFCIGAFFLAATGLLRGRKCSTHWMYAEDFRRRYPDIDLVEDRILTESDGIYTSGGAYSSLNLVLHLIEKYAGREIAVRISKTFMIDINRDSQSPFIVFRGQHAHGDSVILSVQEYLETHTSEKLTVDFLASRAALSRRSLERRFRKATGNSVAEYMQRVKIEAAKKRLETGRESVFEVMYDVGYSDVKAFRNAFSRTTGMTPAGYRLKYNRYALSPKVR